MKLLKYPIPESIHNTLIHISKGDEQCETAWAHILGCELCQFALLWLAALPNVPEDKIDMLIVKLERYKRQTNKNWSWK